MNLHGLMIRFRNLDSYPRSEQKRIIENLAFSFYVRKGSVPPALDILRKAIDLAPLDFRFNPYHDPDNGQFTFSPDGPGDDKPGEDNNTGSGSAVDQAARILQNIFGNRPAGANEIGSGGEDDSGAGDDFDETAEKPLPAHIDSLLGSIQDHVANQQPPAEKDPGFENMTYNDGSTVMDSYGQNPLLMPKGVSLQNNIEIGEDILDLPSIFGDSPIPRDFFPDKEAAMVSLFWPGQSMDYQRIYSDTASINRTYIDFGNYNYGVVAAAAGYSSDEALLGAGMVNFYSTFINGPGEVVMAMSQNSDKLGALQDQLEKLIGRISGTYLNNPRVEKLILQGFNDYASGRYDDGDGRAAP